MGKLILLAGLPGTGKSTIGKNIEKKGVIYLARDDLIGKLFNPVINSSKEQKQITSQTMLSLAEYCLNQNKDVMLDMPFSKLSEITAAKDLAVKTKSKLIILKFECSDDLALSRIRKQKQHSAKDRDENLYFEVKARFEKINLPHNVINTDKSVSESLQQCMNVLNGAKYDN